MIIKYYDREFLVCNELDLKNVLRNYNFFHTNSHIISYQFHTNFI